MTTYLLYRGEAPSQRLRNCHHEAQHGSLGRPRMPPGYGFNLMLCGRYRSRRPIDA
jgi:hypothetical protein